MAYKDQEKRKAAQNAGYARRSQDPIWLANRQAKQDAWRANLPEDKKVELRAKSLARMTKLRKDKPEWQLLKAAKARAKKKGIEFSIDVSDIRIPSVCPILGIPLVHNYGGGTFADNSPSLDRIIQSKGYTPGNVQVISWRANRLKCDGTYEECCKIAESLKPITTGDNDAVYGEASEDPR